MTRVAVCIAHAEWAEGREKSLSDLIDSIPCGFYTVFRSIAPESSELWASKMWEWGAEQDAEAVVYLNDDVELCDNFVDVVKAMWQDEPLSLHTSAPDQRTRWARSFWMTGPAYVLSPEMTKDLLAFAEESWSENEDNVGTRWAWARGRPFYSPVPCPVRHRTDVPSTLGYDDHPYRVTRHFQKSLPTDAAFWKMPEDVPLVQNPWFRP